ncbi:MAG: sodium/solute symporter [Bryobacterales bacterium]|nr:sodium/solute symporter [Bryobacterales bacterium]
MYASEPFVWIAFILYLAATFGFAWLAHRKGQGGSFLDEFFVAGRSIGPWTLALTWIATAASGGSFIGVPALAYTYGWPILLWICSYMVVALLGFGMLASRISDLGRKTGALTYPDLLRDRFESPAIGAVAGVAIVLLYMAYMEAQYVAGSRVLEAVLGIPYTWGLIGFAVTVGLYTTYGGFRAVAWTDAFQAVVMLFGVVLAAGLAVRKVGGFEALAANLQAQDPELLTLPGPDGYLPISAAVSFFVIWPLATAGQPSLMSRFLASKGGGSLKRAMFLVGLYILLLYPSIILIAIAGRALTPGLETADHAMPATILAATPPWLAGFVLAAPMAAIMSTLSSFLLVGSSAIVRDLYERNLATPISEQKARQLTHVATLVIAVIPLVFAFRPPEFLQYIVVFSGTGLSATFVCPTLFALYWPGFNRVGCLAAMLGGFGSFLFQYLQMGSRSYLGLDPFVWSLGVSAICGVLGWWLGPPDRREVRERYFGEA